MIETTLTIADIRNKLSPITHLIWCIENDKIEHAKECLPIVKQSVNHLCQKEKYKL